MNPIPQELLKLPQVNVVNEDFVWDADAGLYLESNAFAAADAMVKLPSIRTYNDGVGKAFGFAWQVNQSTSNVQMYPEAKFGRKPWDAGSTTKLLPRRLRDLAKLEVDLRYQFDADGSANVAFDVWLTKDATTVGVDGIKAEFMHWLDKRGSIQPAGDNVENIAGLELWMSPGFGDGPAWPYFAFVVPFVPQWLPQTVDLLGLLQALVSRGSITDDLFVSSVEFGCEAIDGSGWLYVDQYEIKVE